ncbi:MAG: KaiC domain-containing protein [Euryarchaeota archaeon]|nr:KaiC domain-containing protein [Euryarchaeota archaeon]
MVGEYFTLGELEDRAPKLFGIPTGTRLDELFFKVEKTDADYERRPLGGIPYLAVLNITGIPDTGKSILAEQFAVTQAGAGYRVLYVTVESPANFLYTALRQKSDALGVDFSQVERNVVVIDASASEELRENPRALLDTMGYAIKEKKITNVVIDSITGLYEHKEVAARQIVRQFFNFLKKWRQTALLVSQKRSAQASESAEAAGGLAVAHILDGTIVLDKKLIETRWDVSLYRLPLGSVLRTLRIDGCRLAPHDSRTWVFEITDLGIIDIIAPLEEYIKKK